MPTLAFQWASLQLRGLLDRFPGAATIKWMAPTHQPNMKLVMGLSSKASKQYLLSAPAILCKGAAAIKWLVSTHQPNIKLVMGLSSKASKQYLLSASAIPLHSFNRPASANANPGLSMGQFAIAWATWKISRRSHYKMAGPNPSTQHEIGDWIEFQGFQAILAVGTCHPLQRCSRYKMAGLNPSTQHKIGDWIEFQGFQAMLAVSICHPLQRCSRYKIAGLNPSTQHKICDWMEFQGFQAILAVGICNPCPFYQW